MNRGETTLDLPLQLKRRFDRTVATAIQPVTKMDDMRPVIIQGVANRIRIRI